MGSIEEITTPEMTFKEIPILDLSLARSEETKPEFLRQLRGCLLTVGFLYIKNTGIDQETYDRVCEEGIKFFDLPEEEKLAIEMKNAPSFLGYNRLGTEVTAFKNDWREQIDLSTPHRLRQEGEPLYNNLWSPNLWPSEKLLPNFRPVYEDYMAKMSDVSMFFTSLIAEAIDLEPNAFDRFFDEDQQHKLKIIKYPDSGDGVGQGVGPHKDSMLSSYLLQATDHKGLQVQNTKGEWIDCPPIKGTLVVAIGQGLEAVTGGVTMSTTHRVLSPAAGSGSRFSIPFFQGVSYDAQFESMDVPAHVRKLRSDILDAQNGRRDDVEFTFVKGRWNHLGEATLMNRIKSHPDVGERWYPDLLRQIRLEQQQASAEAEVKESANQSLPQKSEQEIVDASSSSEASLPNAAENASQAAIEAH